MHLRWRSEAGGSRCGNSRPISGRRFVTLSVGPPTSYGVDYRRVYGLSNSGWEQEAEEEEEESERRQTEMSEEVAPFSLLENSVPA